MVDAAAISALAVNAAALIWGAAQLKAEVAHLRTIVTRFEQLLDHWTRVVTSHGERIARLEASQE